MTQAPGRPQLDALAARWGRRLVLVVPLLLLAGPASARPPEAAAPTGLPTLGGEVPKQSPVTARLLADPGYLTPEDRRPITLGVHLHMDSGWHTYWKNGGDAGLPTQVEWDLPTGATAGELQWPTPHRYVEAGDLVTFGYQDDVVLLAEFTPPAGLRAGQQLNVRANVSWLMCKELCIPGSAQVELQLPVRSDAAGWPAMSDQDAALLQAARTRLPRPATQWDALSVTSVVSLSAIPAGQSAHVALRVAGLAQPDSVRLTWFPEYLEALELGAPTSRVLDKSGSDSGPELGFAVPVKLGAAAPAGQQLPVRGVLELQAPAAPPVYLAVDVPVRVAAPEEAVQGVDDQLFARILTGAGVGQSVADGGLLDSTHPLGGATAAPSRSLAYYLLLALVGGIILNVMPCVLPVLSLKVLGFVQHANEDRRTVLQLSLLFALGVLASFAALAIVVIALQAAGQQLGWGFQFQNPVFVVVMAAVVFAFGLSMFGVYEVVLPVQFGGGGRRGAAAESFVSGLLATALATPCTAPFLGTALGFAFTQPAWAILAIFLTIGVGLALPYVVLSLNPAWLKAIPRPGAWMERFKQAMGFLLMATVVWLLWVLGNQKGLSAVVWTLAFLLALGLALWLHGSLLDLSSGARRRAAVWTASLAIVAAAAVGFLRGPLGQRAAAAAGSAGAAKGADVIGGVAWEPFELAALETAVRNGRTVFIDFTAEWCWTCKVNERTVLADAAVTQRMQQLQVLAMKGDWTNRDPVITQVLRRFGRSGVPFYAVFPAGQLGDPIVLPELINASVVLQALEKAGPSHPPVRTASAGGS